MGLSFNTDDYSGTSDSGPSEKGTLYIRPLYKAHCSRSPKLLSLWFQYIENLREEDSLSIKDKTTEFILSPKCPLFAVCPNSDSVLIFDNDDHYQTYRVVYTIHSLDTHNHISPELRFLAPVIFFTDSTKVKT